MSDEIFGSALAGASGNRRDVAGAIPDIGRGRTLDGHGERAKPLARFGSKTLSLADPMEPPPVLVTERNNEESLPFTPPICQGTPRRGHTSGEAESVEAAEVFVLVQAAQKGPDARRQADGGLPSAAGPRRTGGTPQRVPRPANPPEADRWAFFSSLRPARTARPGRYRPSAAGKPGPPPCSSEGRAPPAPRPA